MRHAVVAALTAACAFLGLAAAADAQAGPNQQPLPFTITAAGQSSGVYNLSGQSSCAVVVYNSGSGLTLVPQATSDTIGNIATGAAQWTTVSAINSGSINTFGSYVGNVAATGLTGFRVTATTLSSGPVQGSLYCSNASSASGGGAVTGNVGLNAGSNTVGYVGLIGGSNTIGNVGVTGPLPAGTNALGSVTVANLASPAPYIAIGVNPSATATPAAFDANNNLQTILGPNHQQTAPVTGALNASTVSIPTGGMGTIRYSTLNSTLTGTPFTIAYQVSNDNTTWATANCLALGGSASSAYHTSQSGLEQGSCDVTRAHWFRFTLSAFSGTATGNLIADYSFASSPSPCIQAANGVCIALVSPSDTLSPTNTGLPVISSPQIFSGLTQQVRQYACTQTASITNGTANTPITAAGSFLIIAGIATQQVYVCAYHLTVTGSSLTVQWSGAGTCGTAPTYFGTTEPFTSGTVEQAVFAQNSGFQVAINNGLCLQVGGTVTNASGWVQYSQFVP